MQSVQYRHVYSFPGQQVSLRVTRCMMDLINGDVSTLSPAHGLGHDLLQNDPNCIHSPSSVSSRLPDISYFISALNHVDSPLLEAWERVLYELQGRFL